MTQRGPAGTLDVPPEWQHTPTGTRGGVAARIGRWTFILIVALLFSHYIAGYVLLWSFGLSPHRATPLTVWTYYYYYSDVPRIRARVAASAICSVALVLPLVVVLALPRRRSLHGDARFATPAEIQHAGLLTGRGIILGQVGPFWRKRFLTLPGQQGVSLSAQPRAGKGVGVVVPNLLTWGGSLVCIDIKFENWTLTAGYRASSGQRVFLFDPLAPDGRTHRWNMLDYVGETLNERINDLQLIGNMIFPDPVGADPFWMASARSLFLGTALYVLETPSLPRTIGEILRQGMADDEEGFSHHWHRVIQGRMRGASPLPAQCVRALSDVIDLAPQTASSIRKTFTSRLELWANPFLDAATSSSDFDLRQLRREPMSIYLAVRPKDLPRLQPLLSLFFQQSIALQTDQLPEHNPALRYQVLMLGDEFPALQRIPIVANTSGFLPGFNVRLLLVMQTPAQLREVYGEHGAHILQKTLAARIYFAPKDIDEAEEISRELGDTTVKVKTLSRPTHGSFDPSRGHRSVNISEQRRPLMLPQEVRDMGSHRELVFLEGVRPIFADKIRYYRIRYLRKRVMPPPRVNAIVPTAPSPGYRSSPENDMRPVSPSETSDPQHAEPEYTVRDATIEDLNRIDELTLDDFDIDPDALRIPEKPPGERLSEAELKNIADNFLAALHRER
jgi:type IV secretion system protein VirD4